MVMFTAINNHGFGPPGRANIYTQNTTEEISKSAVNPPDAPLTKMAATKSIR